MAYDLLSDSFLKDPYPTLAELREHCPVYWSGQLQAWLVLRYSHVVTCLSDRRISADRLTPRVNQFQRSLQVSSKPLFGVLSKWPLMLDQPGHTRYRALINQAMTRSTIERFVPTVQRLSKQFIEAGLVRGGMDVVADLAYPLPLSVVAELIGVPPEGRHLLKACAVDIVNFFGCDPPRYEETVKAAASSVGEATAFLRQIIQHRRRVPASDLITDLIAAVERGDMLDDEEIVSVCLMMAFAGYETTTNLIGNGLLTLLTHPTELRKIREDRSLLTDALDEILRFEPPVQRLSRMATTSFELHSHQVREGDLMFLMVSAANRDPERFADPDRFDVARIAHRSLSFGHSIHTCPGSTLAKIEAHVVFEGLLRNVTDIRLLDDEPDWQRNLSIRSLRRLPVSFH